MESGTSSSSNTLTRGRQNKLGLLLKQYYEDPAGLGSDSNQYSLSKLEKLKTDQLMARSVESLRSYKEAESELRMLLYNNCEKLLEAVQVVCTIREGSGSIVKDASELEKVANRIENPSQDKVMMEYKEKMKQMNLLAMMERVAMFPTYLRDSTRGVDERIRQYLLMEEKIFSRAKIFEDIWKKSKDIVENELVPVLMQDLGKTARVHLLMELFPESHPRHKEMLGSFIESEVDRYSELVARHNMSKTEALSILNGIITTLFLTRELDPMSPTCTSLVSRINEKLIPRSSDQILIALLRNRSMDSENIAEFIQNAISVHMRIPMVSRQGVEIFSKQAILNHIESRFSIASNVCINEDLVSLLFRFG